MTADPILNRRASYVARRQGNSKKWCEKNPLRVAARKAANRQGIAYHDGVRVTMHPTRPKPLRCEVCRRKGGSGQPGNPKPLHFDHCHVALQFRGWLCAQCNQVLGLVNDNPETLRALARYLEAFQIADLTATSAAVRST